jgi:hypothetical protein
MSMNFIILNFLINNMLTEHDTSKNCLVRVQAAVFRLDVTLCIRSMRMLCVLMAWEGLIVAHFHT